jgi:diguanylate cyclase (GGDEF)-like protein/PAS domain S-box-containing protein
LPVITLLFFAYNIVIEKHHQLRNIQNALHFNDIADQLAETVHQLQAERGLSAGVFANRDQVYPQSLIWQRQQTDVMIKQLAQIFANVPDYLTEKERDKLNHINTELAKLATIRLEIDQFSDDRFFDFYSQLIKNILNVISFLKTFSTISDYHNMTSSYLNVLWLKEYAARERGALHGVFSAQQLKIDQFSTITSDIAGQHAALRNFYNTATTRHQVQVRNIQSHPATLKVKHFREIIFNKAIRNDALNGLQILVGYGGLIHDFKNYVIRGDAKYSNNFQRKFDTVRHQIEAYKKLPNISRQEKDSLNIIRDTLQQYQGHLATISAMKEKQASINQIDQAVVVDDQPALNAINYLRHNLTSQDAEYWWQQASARLDLIHKVSTFIAEDLDVLGQKIEADTRYLLNLYLVLTILVLFLTGIIGMKLRSRLVREIRYIADTIRISQKNKQLNQLLTVTGDDEIADMANAFNNLILERTAAEGKLQLAAQVFSETHEGISITDPNGTIIDVNPAFCEITGYSHEEVIGNNHNMLSSGRQSPEFYTNMWRILKEQGYWKGEIWNRKKNGELYAELLTISSLKGKDGNVTNYVGFFSDITQSKQQQKSLELMAHYDVLTQLPNRILLIDRFSRATAHCKRQKTSLAVCFLDLDNFKPVNDRFGHDVGDRLLIAVAERITHNIREEDTVARLGGDEFVILLGNINADNPCEYLLERLIQSLSQSYDIDQKIINIGTSIGVTVYPQDDADIDTLLRHADQAMYQAKLAGKNVFRFFNAEKKQQALRRHTQLQEIEQGFSNNEFCLYYQPKLNMRTGNVFGAEALIRWQKPDNGIVPPLEFLPLLENTELEIKLGNWVIHEALEQLDEWISQGIKLEISINISSYHLQSPSFFTHLAKTLAKFPNVDPEYLQLEILESSMLGDIHIISDIIKTCRDLGVRIALDDFGTGYSSLNHLRKIPADTIKIDQSFVKDMLTDPDVYSIIDGVIGLADSFNRQVIAEGVETIEHGLMLQLMGCEQAQGYGIAKPMPANEIIAWLNNYTANEAWMALGSKICTTKEKKIELLKLTSDCWFRDFEKKWISQDSDKNSLIIDHAKCHQCFWIKRERGVRLFEQHWLDNIAQLHEQVHALIETLIGELQAGEVDIANENYKKLQKILKQIDIILAQQE